VEATSPATSQQTEEEKNLLCVRKFLAKSHRKKKENKEKSLVFNNFFR